MKNKRVLRKKNVPKVISKKQKDELEKFKKLKPQQKQKIETKQDMQELSKDDRKKIFSFKDRLKLKKSPEDTFVITMLFGNGTSKTFVLKGHRNTFLYRKKMYLLLYEENYFDLSLNLYHLFYHEDSCVPINREIALEFDSSADPEDQDAFFTVTPHNLKEFIKMEYIKILASSTELSKIIKLAVIVGILAFLVGLINAGLVYNALYAQK